MATRYKERLHTPGDNKPGKPEIIRFDQGVAEDFTAITARLNELTAKQGQVKAECDQIQKNLGAMVAENCDYKEYLDRLAELRLETEAIEAGISYLRNRGEFLKRTNSWL